jgi:recombination-promoting nuclease RpnB
MAKDPSKHSTEKRINKAHDHFFRRMMSDKCVAKSFFEAHLSKEVLAQLDLNTLELQPTSYIDDRRKESIIDLLFKTKIAGEEGYLYLFIDHQSRPDKLMPVRVLKYQCNMLDQKLSETGGDRIPLIIPLIVYHGKTPWNYSTDINDLVDGPKHLVERYFLKPFTLIDLNKIEDELLRRHTWSSVMELTLKHIFKRDMLPHLQLILELIRELAVLKESGYPNFTEDVLVYILDRGEFEDKDAFFALVKTRLTPEIGETIMSIAEQMRAEGIQKAKYDIAKRLLAKKEDPSTIAEITELTLDQIKEIEEQSH